MGTSLLSPKDCLSSPRGRQMRTFPTISRPSSTERTSTSVAFGPSTSDVCSRHGGPSTLRSPVRCAANLSKYRGLVDLKDQSLGLLPVPSQFQQSSSTSHGLQGDISKHVVSSQSSTSQVPQSHSPLRVSTPSHFQQFPSYSSASQTSNTHSLSMFQKTKSISGALTADLSLKVLSWFPECRPPVHAFNVVVPCNSDICKSNDLPHHFNNVPTKFHYKAKKKPQLSKHACPSSEIHGRKYLNNRTNCQYQRKRTHPEPPQVSDSDLDEVDRTYNVLKPSNRNARIAKTEKDAHKKKEYRHGLVRVKSNAVLIDGRRNASQDSERWAGPSYFNSPPPSSLPLPTFASMPKASHKPVTYVHSMPVSRTGSPDSCNDCAMESDADSATKFLKKLLNLESASL